MADNVTITSGANSTPPAGTVVATDQDSGSGAHYPINKLCFGALDTFTLVTASVGFPVQQQTGATWTVTGAVTQSGTWNIGTVTTVTTVTTVSTVTAVSDAQVQGKAAHDAAVSGNPVLLGAYASAAAPTAVSADGDAVRLWADLAGRLQVGDGGGSITVDNGGTFAVQAAQSGTWTVQPGNTANTTAWLVTGTGGTFPVTDSGGSLTVDNAGTFAVQVDGAALTALQLIDNLVLAEDAAHSTGDPGVQLLAVRTDTPANRSGADGDYEPLQMSAGRLHTSAAQSGTWNVGTVTTLTSITNAVTVQDGGGVLSVDDAGSTLSIDDGGGSITVDGTLTVGTHSVDSITTSVTPGTSAAHLGKAEDAAHSSGDTGVMALAVRRDSAAASSGTDGDYEPLSTDNTGQLRVNVGNTVTVGSHAVTNAGTFAVQVDGAALTALQLIDDVVFAEDAAHTTGDKGVQVLTVRKDTAAATSGTDGDYQPPVSNARGATWVAIEDGAGGQITSFGGGTQYTEDAAAAANPVGTAVILVRADTPATLVSADGDNVAQRGSNYGASYVTLIDNAGAFVSVGGGTQYDEDTAHSSGDKLNMAGAVRRDTAASSSGTDGDRSTINVDASGKLWVNAEVTVALPAGTNAIGKLAANSGVDIGDVDVTSIVPGTGATNLGKAEDAAHSSGDTGVMALAVRTDTPANRSGADGDYEPLQMAAGRLWVDASGVTLTVGSHAVTNAGTFAVQTGAERAEDAAHSTGHTGLFVLAVRSDTAAQTAGTDGDYCALISDSSGRLHVNVGALPASTNTIEVVGDAAHDAAAAGNPLLCGGEARTTNPTAVSDGDAVRRMHDDVGRTVVCVGQVRDLLTHATTTISGSTSETTILSAAGAGVFLDVVCVVVCNTSATAVRVDFKDATAGTTRFSIYAPAGQTVGFAPTRPVTQASANNNWTATCSASVTDVRIFAQAEKNV